MCEKEEAASLRQVIESFIDDRFKTKVEKLTSDDPKYLKLQDQFEYQRWIAKAVKDVRYLQVVTHLLKGIHSGAQGTSLNVDPSSFIKSEYVGSHCLPRGYIQDISVVNAAALYVHSFLQVEFRGKTLLDRALALDSNLIDALSLDRDEAESWVKEFATIIKPKHISSHSLGKQIYWLVNDDVTADDSYVVLAPLYPTSLIQSFFTHLQEAPFSDRAKQGRQARHGGKYFEGAYVDYPYLAVQKLGGSNAQNVSKLNKRRGGKNYLLSSLPPQWQSPQQYPPTRDAFRSFEHRPIVYRTVRELKRFLESAARNNMHTKDYRDDLTAVLIDELMLFTFDMHALPAGWSAAEKNQLSDAERYWLDPGRVAEDSAFAEARRVSDWHQAISARAASWLNKFLNKNNSLSMADAEHRHWEGQIEEVMKDFRRQLDDLQDALLDDEREGEAV